MTKEQLRKIIREEISDLFEELGAEDLSVYGLLTVSGSIFEGTGDQWAVSAITNRIYTALQKEKEKV